MAHVIFSVHHISIYCFRRFTKIYTTPGARKMQPASHPDISSACYILVYISCFRSFAKIYTIDFQLVKTPTNVRLAKYHAVDVIDKPRSSTVWHALATIIDGVSFLSDNRILYLLVQIYLNKQILVSFKDQPKKRFEAFSHFLSEISTRETM